jgi:hypothetical protein
MAGLTYGSYTIMRNAISDNIIFLSGLVGVGGPKEAGRYCPHANRREGIELRDVISGHPRDFPLAVVIMISSRGEASQGSVTFIVWSFQARYSEALASLSIAGINLERKKPGYEKGSLARTNDTVLLLPRYTFTKRLVIVYISGLFAVKEGAIWTREIEKAFPTSCVN